MSRHYWGAVLVTAVVALRLCSHALAPQQTAPVTSPSTSSQSPAPTSPAQTAARSKTDPPASAAHAQSDSSADAGAQIDELIQQSNEAMNVKVQFQLSEELARQALELSEKAGDKGRAAMAMVYLSAALSYQGRLAESLEVAQKNVPVARESGDKKALEQALNSLASITGGMGRYEEGLGIFYECLDLAREINDPTMQYVSLLNIGEAYVRSDDPDKAELPLQQSLRIARELKPNLRASNPSKKATEMALLNLGGMEMARQHYRAALDYYEHVHVSKPESSLWVVAALEGVAASYEQLGEPQKAIEFIDQAMPIAEKSASGVEYRNLLSALGVNQEKLGNLDAALASENKALALMHEAGGDPDSEWQVESRIAHIQRGLGNNGQALEHYRKSIGGIELLRSVALNTEEGRAGVLARSRATYAETADLLYELNRKEEALDIAERGRARAFLEILAEARVGVADELSPKQRKREDAILAHISAVQKNLWREDVSRDDKKRYAAERSTAEAGLEEFHLEVRQSNPRYASLQYPEPVSVNEIRNQLLDDHTALVEYLLGEKRSLVWVVTRNNVTTAVLPPRKAIEEQVAAYRKVLAERASALTIDQSLREVGYLGTKLHRTIFQPVESAVASVRQLIIVPDGSLDYLPFEALVVSTGQRASGYLRLTYLAEKFNVVYGPSASALAAVQTMNRETAVPPKILLAFGDPIISSSADASAAAPANGIWRARNGLLAEDYLERGFSLARLPYTRDEVLAISKLFPTAQIRVYLGAEASEDRLKAERLQDFRYIHLASHGFLDEIRPARSGILLSRTPQSSEDGILQMREIMALKMNADLVTLSACSTGLGKLVNGEGVLGLTRALFYAGARNVAVSLWNVNDSATAALMKEFYQNLYHGLGERAALRQAKLKLIRDNNIVWRHPYYWAAFVLVGEGK